MAEIVVRLDKSTATQWGNDTVRKFLADKGMDLSQRLGVKEIGTEYEYTGDRLEKKE